MNLHTIKFLKSAAALRDCPPDSGQEVAFAGRSNAGKSTAINVIANIKGLARTSKTPGRTQLINFFEISEHQRLVDLPGYGYAAVPQSIKIAWQKSLSTYLNKRQALKGIILLMDIRHPLKEFDTQMIQWCANREPILPVHILLTKADKLNRGPAMQVLQTVYNTLQQTNIPLSIQLFSALNKIGLEDVKTVIAGWLDTPPSDI